MKFLFIVVSLCVAASANAAASTLRLLDDVTVANANVRLSDLLPPTGARVRTMIVTASQPDTVIGSAPQPGSIRVLTGAEIEARLSDKRDFEVPALVVVRRQQFPIEPEAIMQVLKDSIAGREVDFSRAQIRVPAGFGASVPKPQLELLGLSQGFDPATLIARLRCRERSAYGRFVAEITLPADKPVNGGSRIARHSSNAFRSRPPVVMGPFLVRPGVTAWLVSENQGMRITQTVMPMARARTGEMVRVSDPVTHRILLAQVAGERLLRPSKRDRRGKTRKGQMKMKKMLAMFLMAMSALSALSAKEKDKANSGVIQRESLDEYLRRMQQASAMTPTLSPGSLWVSGNPLTDIASDYKAHRVGDLITVTVVEDITATNAGSISSARNLSASSGISALPAQLKTTNLASLFSPTSAYSLTGKGQAATTSSLRTSLAGRVVGVLPGGSLVIEAERQLTMNNERQTVLLRGLVRPGDVGPGGAVASNSIANLELELKGKGVISEGNRQPNTIVRMILRVVGF